jgi:hypothetical protein
VTGDSFTYTVPLRSSGGKLRDHVEVTAWETINPNLCVHLTVDDLGGIFTLSHKATGASLARCDDLGIAQKLAGALNEIIDWNHTSRKPIIAQFERLDPKVQAWLLSIRNAHL